MCNMYSESSVVGSGKSIFEEFLGEEIKAPYQDGSQMKVAKGVLKGITNGFVKIEGELGTIVINERNIVKMARLR